MLPRQARVVHASPIGSPNYVRHLLLAKISDGNFVRFGSVDTPMQIRVWRVTVQADQGGGAGWIPG